MTRPLLFMLFKKQIFVFILLILFNPLLARNTVTSNYPSCSASGAVYGGSTTCAPCTSDLEEQFFGEGQVADAYQACIDYLQGWNPNYPNNGCIISNSGNPNGTTFERPGCHVTTPNTISHHTYGIFYTLNCPTGTHFDGYNGCIEDEDDRGEDCPAVTAGNPINTATGNKYHSETINTGDGLYISLSYNSHIRINEYGNKKLEKFGYGWTMSANMNISPIYSTNNQQYVIVHRGNGRYIRFNKIGSQWLSEMKDKDILEKTTDGWKYYNKSGAIETYDIFDNRGSLSKIEKNGNILNYIQNNSQPQTLSRIQNQNGNYIDFQSVLINGGYRYTSITYNSGRQWLFGYVNNNLTTITYPDNTVKTFHYENAGFPNAMTGITDRNGIRYATYDYDAQGRVFHETHAGNAEELTIAYNPNNTRTITNSRGKVSTYTVEKNNGRWQIKDISGPGCSNCSNANTSFVYDPATNDLLTKTVDGQITQYSNYDSKGQYGTKIEAFGTTEQRQTDYTYDARFFKKPLTITEPSVATGQNKVTTYTYDGHANILSMTVSGYKADGTAVSAITTYQYNGPYNQISQIDGPRTDVVDTTSFDYYLDDPSEGNNRGRLKKMTNAAGIIMRDNIQYSPTGKILSEDKPNGITTNYTYYAGNDRLQTVANTDGTKTITTHMDYLASGEIKEIIRNYNTADASTLTLTYDDARRLTKVTDQQGNYVEYTLDTEGNQLFEKTYDPNNVLKKLIAQVFDDYDQVDTTTQSGVTNDLDYGSNGNLNQQTNGNNVITDYSYDALNRLTQITQDFGTGTLPTSNTITAFEYDTQDRVSKVTDANNHNTLYQYDDLGRLTKLTSPDTGIDVFTYDAAGNVLSKLDANGNTTHFSYDALNRPTTLDYVGTDLDVTFIYDQGTNGLNQLSSFADSYSTTTLGYDAFGNLTGKTQTVNNITTGNNISQSLSYNYDANNRLQSLTYPSGLVVTYHYNNLNQITGISTIINGQNIDIANNISYLPMGPLTSMDMGNGIHYSANYDNGYRLNNYQYGTTLSGIYSYDSNHNITNISRESIPANTNYSYDNLDRIKQESGGPTNYSYDKLGNRTSSTYGRGLAVPYEYDVNSNKLIKVGNVKPRSYDANGNTLASFGYTHRFSYNKANRMVSYRDSKYTLKAEYSYNGIGQRIYKQQIINGGKGATSTMHHLFIYNANGQLLQESIHDATGTQTQSRDTIWLGNKPIAQIRTINGTSTIYYILTDHLNTPRKLTNATGTVLWSWNSDAFGTTQANEDVDGNGANFEFNLRFPGQYFDKESGIHYNYFRDYEAGTGRYLESDPIGLYGNWNTFEYVNSQPLKRVDVSGLICDNCTTTGLPPKFQAMMRERLLPSCRLDDTCCKKSYTSCVVDCVGELNPWWTAPAGGGLAAGALAEGACGTASTYAGVVLGGWAAGTSIGCVTICFTNPCSY